MTWAGALNTWALKCEKMSKEEGCFLTALLWLQIELSEMKS